MKKNNRYLFVDGNYLMHRSFHSISGLESSDGIATNAIYGFLKTFMMVLRRFSPGRILVAWDCMREENARVMWTKKLLKEGKIKKSYKSSRGKANKGDDLYTQFDYTKKILGLLGVSQLMINHFEADDIIAGAVSAVSLTKLKAHEIIILTGDKDYVQLLSFPNVRLCFYDVSKKEWVVYESGDIIDGVKPEDWVYYGSLMGDASDDIPGVPGIGPAKAKVLMEHVAYEDILRYNSLSVLDRACFRTGHSENVLKIFDAVMKNYELFITSRALKEMKGDVLRKSEKLIGCNFRLKKPSVKALGEIFNELDMNEITPLHLIRCTGRL